MSRELTKEDIQAIGLAAAKATKGPWKREGASVHSVDTGYIMETSGTGGHVGSLSSPRGTEQRDLDAGYIAMLDPETVDALCELAWRYLDLQD